MLLCMRPRHSAPPGSSSSPPYRHLNHLKVPPKRCHSKVSLKQSDRHARGSRMQAAQDQRSPGQRPRSHPLQRKHLARQQARATYGEGAMRCKRCYRSQCAGRGTCPNSSHSGCAMLTAASVAPVPPPP